MPPNEPIDILGLTSAEFLTCAAAHGVKAPAALALYRQAFRTEEPLPDWIALPLQPLAQTQHEGDTIKFTQRLDGRLETETVVLPQRSRLGRSRNTLCVSSQIGCAMGCTFCETAQMGLMRNLTPAQIVAQWRAATLHFAQRITNIVFMGMGEPMDNLDAVIQAIRVLADPHGPEIAPSRIAVSTVGRAEGIRRLAAFAQQPGFRKLALAVSVNAPNDAVRSQIMPINRATPMAELRRAMDSWPTGPTKRILIEYVFIPGVNDAMEHADELCAYLEGLYTTVNIIPYNPRQNSPWPAPDESHVRRFIERIASSGQFVKRRKTMGRSLMAACGQLGSADVRRRRFVTLG
jgi:23S rRNA (adenine2503-C2)-methyltransferase